jgi:protein neuralized
VTKKKKFYNLNSRISDDGFTATRINSFCHGILFSNRPIMVGERIYLQLTDVSKFWHGVIRIGISAHNPSSIRHLPKHACPDLAMKPGYWAKSLGEKLIVQGRVVHFYISRNGNIHYGLDGKDLGIFHFGIDTRQTLWAMIDLYGSCTSLRMINFRSQLVESYYNTLQTERFVSWPQQEQQHQLQPHQTLRRGIQHRQTVRQQQQQQQRNNTNYNTLPNTRPAQVSPLNHSRVADARVPPLHDDGVVSFRRMTFHRNVGQNVRLDATSAVATRCEDEFSQGYVFGSSVVNIGEWIVVEVVATEESFIGSLAFGLTNCNPASLNVKNLPEDSDLLLDRSEYWVVVKDVASSPAAGEALSFRVSRDGAVEFSKNGGTPVVIMHVDASRPLYPFWDLFGHTSKVRLLGATSVSAPPTGLSQPKVSAKTSRLQSPDSGIDLSIRPESQQQLSECVICFENGNLKMTVSLAPRLSLG